MIQKSVAPGSGFEPGGTPLFRASRGDGANWWVAKRFRNGVLLQARCQRSFVGHASRTGFGVRRERRAIVQQKAGAQMRGTAGLPNPRVWLDYAGCAVWHDSCNSSGKPKARPTHPPVSRPSSSYTKSITKQAPPAQRRASGMDKDVRHPAAPPAVASFFGFPRSNQGQVAKPAVPLSRERVLFRDLETP